MLLTRQRRCLLLLLLVLASQLSLTMHVATHQGPDTVNCQLCIGYHNAGQAVASTSVVIEAVPTGFIRSIPLLQAPVTVTTYAPPFSA